MFTTFGSAGFSDVTVGGNGTYVAQLGYDRITGIGAPKGYAFAMAL